MRMIPYSLIVIQFIPADMKVKNEKMNPDLLPALRKVRNFSFVPQNTNRYS